MIKRISDDCCSFFYQTELQLGTWFFNSYVTFNINYASVCLPKRSIFALLFKKSVTLQKFQAVSHLTHEPLTSEIQPSPMAVGKDTGQSEETIKHFISLSMNETEKKHHLIPSSGIEQKGSRPGTHYAGQMAQSSSEGSLIGLLKTP